MTGLVSPGPYTAAGSPSSRQHRRTRATGKRGWCNPPPVECRSRCRGTAPKTNTPASISSPLKSPAHRPRSVAIRHIRPGRRLFTRRGSPRSRANIRCVVPLFLGNRWPSTRRWPSRLHRCRVARSGPRDRTAADAVAARGDARFGAGSAGGASPASGGSGGIAARPDSRISRTTLAMGTGLSPAPWCFGLLRSFKVPHRAEIAVSVAGSRSRRRSPITRGAIGFSSFAVRVKYTRSQNPSACTLGRRVSPAAGLVGCPALARVPARRCSRVRRCWRPAAVGKPPLRWAGSGTSGLHRSCRPGPRPAVRP